MSGIGFQTGPLLNYGGTSDSHQITNNNIDGYNSYGIFLYRNGPYFSGDDQRVADCIIANNVVKNISGNRPVSISGSQLIFGSGIYVQGAENFTVLGNKIRRTNEFTNSSLLAPGGIGVVNSGEGIISDNSCFDGRFGIYIKDPLQNGAPSGVIQVRGNKIRNMVNVGIQVSVRQNVSIDGNSISQTTQQGIFVESGAVSFVNENIQIQNNKIVGAGNNAIVVSACASPLISDNEIDCRTLTTATATAIISGGAVTGFNFTPGSNYVAPPQVFLTADGNSSASAVATISGGTVNAITPVVPGSGYTQPPFVALIGGQGRGGGSGITVGNSSDPIVSGNDIKWASVRGIDMQSTVTGDPLISNNRIRDCAVGVFQQVPCRIENNVLGGNTADYSGAVAILRVLDDVATPSVRNAKLATNAGSTAITNFSDGYIGQVIYFRAASAITITYGTNTIRLAGNVNFTMTAGDTLALVKTTAGTWDEIGRMDRP